MIELPDKPIPNRMTAALRDRNITLRGASSLLVTRAGARHRVTFGFPPMTDDDREIFTMRLRKAKREGLEIRIPTLYNPGIPGTPVVDGADQSGTTLNIRGFTPGYNGREGFWLTVVESDGTAYLHAVATPFVADGTGDAAVLIEPPLRAPFADGDTVEFAAPYMQGFMDGEGFEWEVRNDQYVELEVTIEEFR